MFVHGICPTIAYPMPINTIQKSSSYPKQEEIVILLYFTRRCIGVILILVLFVSTTVVNQYFINTSELPVSTYNSKNLQSMFERICLSWFITFRCYDQALQQLFSVFLITIRVPQFYLVNLNLGITKPSAHLNRQTTASH